ncbi:MAG: hypothetical protein HY848_03215 [Betaproteobacteria bacterium]|nr:hypothetical protein [Betaproteobacteria bacterium]
MRVISIKSVPGDREAQLLQEGWVKQSTLGEPRLAEVVENYKSLGYEVHVEEFRDQGGGEGCTTCFDAGKEMGQVYGTVYIRSRGDSAQQDELF